MFAVIDVSLTQIITQIIGFVIVLWVLKKYAFRPFMKILDERAKEVKSEYDHIEDEKRDVDKLKESYQKHLINIEEEARKKIQEAVKEGEGISKDIQERARLQAKSIHEKAQSDALLEVEKARVTLKKDIVLMALTATEKVLREKIDDRKHHEIIERAIDELGHVK